MKIKIELDITTEELEELLVPSDKQLEFQTMLYNAYSNAVTKTIWKHVDPHNFTGMNKDD